MMHKILRKLRSTAGESLVEALVAILIFTLASVALFTMVDASNTINRTAKEKDAYIQEQMVEAEKAQTPAATGKAVFAFRKADGTPLMPDGKPTTELDVFIYGQPADGLFSYFKK